MKKLFLVFAMGLGLTTFAQKPTTAPAKHQTEMTPEQHAQKHLEKLTKELNLDAAQQQKVSALLTERNEKVKDLVAQKEAIHAKGSAATAEEKNMLAQKMKDQKMDFETKMKGVLTPEQFKKWMGMRKEGMEKMMGKNKY